MFKINPDSQEPKRPRGITILVGYELLTGIALLGLLLYILTLPDIVFDVFLFNELIPFFGSAFGSFLLAYGFWKGRNWAWWMAIILSLIGIIVLWINLIIVIVQFLPSEDTPNSITLLFVTCSYLASHLLVILYLLKSHVKTIFKVKVHTKQRETAAKTILGSGDSSEAFQKFKLPKYLLTPLHSEEETRSEKPELVIYVKNRLWKQVPSFSNCKPTDEVFIIQQDEDNNSWVQFGDGKTGARLPSGTNNVTATYGTGSGVNGEPKESKLKAARTRLPFIDFTRGIVMILMTWDHVSVFWNLGRRGSEGLIIFSPEGSTFRFRPDFPNFTQFLLRFISHWCAPTFIFLAGTALALSTMRKLDQGESQRSITLRIIKRGAMLLFLEAFVVAPAFFSGGPVPYLYFGVLACIAINFMIFSVIRQAPPIAILALSVLIILGTPFLDLGLILPARLSFWVRWYLKVIIYQPNFDAWPTVGLYPILPWLGVMGIGWCFGIFLTSYDHTKITRLIRPLITIGGVALGLWFVVRLVNDYENYLPRLGTTNNTIQDWLLMGKYPPSLAFLLWTLGGMCFFLSLGLILQNRHQFTQGITGAILTFGRVPLFFYCTHIWLYRFWVGWDDRPTSFNMSLIGTVIFWLIGLGILWFLCRWYIQLKRRYPDSLLKYI